MCFSTYTNNSIGSSRQTVKKSSKLTATGRNICATNLHTNTSNQIHKVSSKSTVGVYIRFAQRRTDRMYKNNCFPKPVTIMVINKNACNIICFQKHFIHAYKIKFLKYTYLFSCHGRL